MMTRAALQTLKEEKCTSKTRCIAKTECVQITQNLRICVATPSTNLVYIIAGVGSLSLERRGVTMPAVAEILSTVKPLADPRGCDLPACPVCADSMVAAEA